VAHHVAAHVIDDALTFDGIAALSKPGIVDKSDDVVDFVEFNPLAGTDYIMVFSVRPLAEDGRVAGSDTMIQLFTLIDEFDLVCEDSYGALTDRDIAPVNAGAAGKVYFHYFVSLNQHTLVTV